MWCTYSPTKNKNRPAKIIYKIGLAGVWNVPSIYNVLNSEYILYTV